MGIHKDRLKEETQGFCDIVNLFDTPPTNGACSGLTVTRSTLLRVTVRKIEP